MKHKFFSRAAKAVPHRAEGGSAVDVPEGMRHEIVIRDEPPTRTILHRQSNAPARVQDAVAAPSKICALNRCYRQIPAALQNQFDIIVRDAWSAVDHLVLKRKQIIRLARDRVRAE
jgi:hypothetical protein